MAAASRRTDRQISASSVVGFLALLAGVSLVAVLSLADRVPGLLRRARGRVEILQSFSVPGDAFTFGHFVAWAGLAMIAAMATRGTLARLVAAVSLASMSLVIEAAQLHLTATRAVEGRDAAANLAGVVIGTFVGVVLSESVRMLARRAHR